jgi:NAD(P)-dependent dehydrogenase (short-subunit alcohol dehydrogenase family)
LLTYSYLTTLEHASRTYEWARSNSVALLRPVAPAYDHGMNEQLEKPRVVIVTGAGRGIGVRVAQRFAQDGSRVAIVDLLAERAEATAASIIGAGGQALPVACDVRSADSVGRMVDEVVERFGTVDVLINAAGGYVPPQMAHETTEETWDLVLDSNLKGMFLCCRAVLPHMMRQRSGRIINFASNAARSVATGLGPEYTAAKAGVLGLTRHLASQYGSYNILVNTIAPGPTRVERITSHLSEETIQEHAKSMPLGRFADPSEHAEVVYFMASPGASFMTGATIDNNGGCIMV